jgi:hypothetical protein
MLVQLKRTGDFKSIMDRSAIYFKINKKGIGVYVVKHKGDVQLRIGLKVSDWDEEYVLGLQDKIGLCLPGTTYYSFRPKENEFETILDCLDVLLEKEGKDYHQLVMKGTNVDPSIWFIKY